MNVLSSYIDIGYLEVSGNILYRVLKALECLLLEPQKDMFRNTVLCQEVHFICGSMSEHSQQ